MHPTRSSRRQFMLLLAALASASGCASTIISRLPKGSGVITGNVFDPRQLNRMGVQHHPVFLRQFRHKDGSQIRDTFNSERVFKDIVDHELMLVVVAKTFTSHQGYFEFKHLPPGHYYVQPLRGDSKFVMILDAPDQRYHAGFHIYRS